jgi:adenylate cyclase
MGRFEEAIRQFKQALELDPLSLAINDVLGFGFLCARQYDQAIEQERKTLDLDANSFTAHSYLGLAYVHKSMYQEGIAELEKAVAISSTNLSLAYLGYGYAAAGRRLEAQKVLDQLNEISNEKYVAPRHRAVIYAGLVEKDMAFEWLEKGYEDRSIFIKAYPGFDPLRSDPRFADLLRRMNLQP